MTLLTNTVSETIIAVQEMMLPIEISMGEIIYNNGDCQILSQSAVEFEFLVDDEELESPTEFSLKTFDDKIQPYSTKGIIDWNRHAYACLLQLQNELQQLDQSNQVEHKKYSKEGMIKRVLHERRQKALKADYRILWAKNIHGEHILTNENGVKYKIFLRDFEREIGYSDSADSQVNKLGTTKHIMFAFSQLKADQSLYNRMSKTFPFVEIYLDPLNDYKISWYYPHKLPIEAQLLISKHFGKSNLIENDKCISFLDFIREAEEVSHIVIRPEVSQKVEAAFEKRVLDDLAKDQQLDFNLINAELFPYQKEGIEFAAFRKAAIIADEMGLGKTIQAIGTAIIKKKVFDFKHTLVVCPASLKAQWKKEIERFSDEKAMIIQGTPEERLLQYSNCDCHFMIVNYETVLRDHAAINRAGLDFLILDEAQKVKNYATKTAHAIKNIDKKHVLVITGTPIENKLIDLFSIVSILDPHFLGPQWEFSYQHCLFDTEKINKINGYYNLQGLKERLTPILIRREKRKVLTQLPNVTQTDIPVELSPMQADFHGGYARGIAQIIGKKFITPYDMQKMQLLLASMRMVCNSTYLVDEATNESPKLDELKYVLLDKLDVKNSDKKIIIFSEWVKMHKLIGKMLRENNIGFVELNGRIPVKNRGELITKFESNSNCKIFLSTEAGGAGLNLQVADTVINFELPWNPAKKNQRIGRIDRLGQTSSHLNIYNFITRGSIEERIAAGLIVKQNLFEGVLDESSSTDAVDFSAKGRSQFLKQIESIIEDLEKPKAEIKDEIEEEVIVNEPEELHEMVDTVANDDMLLTEENITESQPETSTPQQDTPDEKKEEKQPTTTPEEFEQVMNNGMQFISGLFKLSTGKDIGLENQTVEVNKETGEVTLKFKLPM